MSNAANNDEMQELMAAVSQATSPDEMVAAVGRMWKGRFHATPTGGAAGAQTQRREPRESRAPPRAARRQQVPNLFNGARR